MKKQFKQITREQCSRIADSAAGLLQIRQPKEGWIKTVRTALGMSGVQLGKRLGNNRSITAYLERSEREGGITIRKMQEVAEVMECKFVYAFVPETSVEDIIERQAAKQAAKIVSQASVQMMLEDQGLSKAQLQKEIERLKMQLINDMNRQLWTDE